MSRGAGSDGIPIPSSASSPTATEASGINFGRPVQRVGRYRVLAELGRGGMSNVYLAVARGPGGVNKLVVLKALLADLESEPYALTMFLDEVRIAEHCVGKGEERLLVGFVGLQPAAVVLGFAHGFDQELADALAEALVVVILQRPGTEQGLVKQDFLIHVRHADAAQRMLVTRVAGCPAIQRARPFGYHLRDHVQTCAYVFTALGVVRG